MAQRTSSHLAHQFNEPLSYISQEERAHFKKRAITSALRNIGLGLVLFVIHGIADSHRIFGEPRYVFTSAGSDPYGLLAVATVAFMAYGIFQLFTIRRRIVAYAREKLITENPALGPLEQAKTAKQERTRSNIYKVFAFSVLGIAILSVVALVVYAVVFL